MEIYQYIKDIIKTQILASVLLILDLLFPNFKFISHSLEVLALVSLLGMTLGILLSLKLIKKDLIEKEGK